MPKLPPAIAEAQAESAAHFKRRLAGREEPRVRCSCGYYVPASQIVRQTVFRTLDCCPACVHHNGRRPN